MKVLGISCGSMMGNSEIMLRKALMEAEKSGAEVSMIRANDFFIAPCTACGKCRKKDTSAAQSCIFKDDFQTLAEAVLDCDGMIVSFPVYNWSPAGQIKVLAERFAAQFGPEQKKTEKPIGFISVAGAMDEHYYSMGLGPALTLARALGMTCVDQLICGFTTDKGHCLKHADKMEHAGRIGVNVVQAAESRDFSWKGEEGTCPVCHNNMFILKDGKIECPFCHIQGSLRYPGYVETDFSSAEPEIQPSVETAVFSIYQCPDGLKEKWSAYQSLDIPSVTIGEGYQRKEEA